MKFVTWNCSGAFRKKCESILSSEPDIMVIQECENPEKFQNHPMFIEYNHVWKGINPNKGLAVFFRKSINFKLISVDEFYREKQLKWFLTCRLNDRYDLVGVWTHKNESEAFQYIGQFYWFLQNNLAKLNNPIFIGDFNSNSLWDSWDRWWNHSDVVKMLNEIDIDSVYHAVNRESQGQETKKTFFHRKNSSSAYHIDYIFAQKALIDKTKGLELGDFKDWSPLSDHIPIFWTVELD